MDGGISSEAERVLKKNGIHSDDTAAQNKDKTAAELKAELIAAQFQVPKGTKKARLVELAKINQTPATKLVRKVEGGWVGKPKGMLQILWERGFINETNWTQYTVSDPQDKYGNVNKELSLSYLISQKYDFAHEVTMLQHIGNELGINVDRTPKCHPEMAGEGIEYSWGCGKNHHHALPIADKKSKANFLANIRKCTSRDDAHISLKRVRLFSKCA